LREYHSLSQNTELPQCEYRQEAGGQGSNSFGALQWRLVLGFWFLGYIASTYAIDWYCNGRGIISSLLDLLSWLFCGAALIILVFGRIPWI